MNLFQNDNKTKNHSLLFYNITNLPAIFTKIKGGCQHLERPNVELTIFRIFEISNMKITKVQLLNFSIFFFFIFTFFFKFYEDSKYIFGNLLNSKFLEFFGGLKFEELTNLSIFLTFVSFHIRNVWNSEILLFNILMLIPKIFKFEKLANFQF